VSNESEPKVFFKEDLILPESYRKNNTRLLSLLFLLLVGIVLLMLGLAYFVFYPPLPKYYAVNPTGEQILLTDVHQPNMSPPTLIQWATQAVIASNSYSYVNYADNLGNARRYFTSSGWDNFVSALENSGTLDEVQKQRIVVSGVVTQAPVIVWQGILPNGLYGWRLQLPMKISYQSLSEIRSTDQVVSLLISRVDTTFSPVGVGIEEMTLSISGSVF
jgi:intracellular multiplication protein IcmL